MSFRRGGRYYYHSEDGHSSAFVTIVKGDDPIKATVKIEGTDVEKEVPVSRVLTLRRAIWPRYVLHGQIGNITGFWDATANGYGALKNATTYSAVQADEIISGKRPRPQGGVFHSLPDECVNAAP